MTDHGAADAFGEVVDQVDAVEDHQMIADGAFAVGEFVIFLADIVHAAYQDAVALNSAKHGFPVELEISAAVAAVATDYLDQSSKTM